MKTYQRFGLVAVAGVVVGAMAGKLALVDPRGLVVWLVAVGVYALVAAALVVGLVWLQRRRGAQ